MCVVACSVRAPVAQHEPSVRGFLLPGSKRCVTVCMCACESELADCRSRSRYNVARYFYYMLRAQTLDSL